MRKSGDYRGDDSGVVFDQEAKEESYKVYSPPRNRLRAL